MAKLYIANALQQLLWLWEDLNLAAELGFQVNLMIKRGGGKTAKLSELDLEALEGSELNRIGYLVRSIPNYPDLRKILSGFPKTHETHFTPRIPKKMREEFGGDRGLFMDHDFVNSMCRIPQYLLKWNETRRACILNESVPISGVDLREENWLSQLPYHAFFLKIQNPICFHDKESNRDWSVSNFLVCDEEQSVRIMVWADENEHCSLSIDERKVITRAIHNVKRDKNFDLEAQKFSDRILERFLGTYIIIKGSSRIMVVHKEKPVKVYPNLYDLGEWMEGNFSESEEQARYYYSKQIAFIETINGFCKLMATLPPRPTIAIEDSLVTNPDPRFPRQWFELPLQTVDHLETERSGSTVVIRRGIGGEKSPHVRMAHTRKYIQPDGSIKEVKIKEVYVRKDKLTTEQLQGGATEIK